jgi:KUP system potassium uptake protein
MVELERGSSHAGEEDEPERGRRALAAASLAALGIVYGDIGTSPLYALRECFHGPAAVVAERSNVLGVLSAIFWTLVVVVCVKYLVVVLRADNNGEGGILALMALIKPKQRARHRRRRILIALGLFGAALLYGDGMITPAISVLGAVEGLRIATPVFEPYVVPIACGILIPLFLIQRRGTAAVGSIFGPVVLLWFLVIATLGAISLAREPGVLAALDPRYAVRFLAGGGFAGLTVLGAVFLVATGAEALYADIGHFGKRPIRLAWFALVLPALVLNYFGQGALLLRDPSAAENPFFRLVPGWGLYPLVALATAAAVIASQAIISGAFSLTRQGIQLSYAPRMRIEHTSETEAGQIYVPTVNWLLLGATLALVLGFGSSSGLASAYGVAVSTTMVITTILLYVVARRLWEWPLLPTAALMAAFLAVDLAFFAANVVKVQHGGWVPLVIAGVAFTLMATWNRGREILGERLLETSLPLEQFLEDVVLNPPLRAPGTAIFMTGNPEGTPAALLHNLRHNHVLHERVVLLTVVVESHPTVPPAERLVREDLGHSFHRIIAHYGFMQYPSVPEILESLRRAGLEIALPETSFFLGHETLLPTERKGMALWRERLFALMARNAERATAYYRVPSDRVVEIGSRVEL